MKMKSNFAIVCTVLIFFVFWQEANSVIVTGQSQANFVINKVNTTLTFAEVMAQANSDDLIMTDADNKVYKLGPTWTFFSLPEAQKYVLREYSVQGRCSCFKMSCGSDCVGKVGDDCVENNPAAGVGALTWCTLNQAMIALPLPGDNTCWTYFQTKEKEYLSRALNHLATITLTTWPGAANTQVSPGYTLKDSYEGINYTLTGTITKMIPKNHIDTAMYRYAQSVERLVYLDDILTLKEKPRLKDFDVVQKDCFMGAGNYTGSKYNGPKLSDSADRAQFTLITVVHNATVPKLSSLKGINILAVDGGTTEWYDGTFDYIDPCNQQFLTMQRDKMGNVFVQVPPTQSLPFGDILCIAVKEDRTDLSNKLVLYEFRNGTSEWVASTKFIGGLSYDYLDSIQIKITTKSTVRLSLKEGTASLQLIDAEPPMLKLVTSIGMTCQIALSPNCSLSMTTTDDIPYSQKSVSGCGYWFQGVSYNCDGVFGTYHPPAKYTNAPLSAFFVKANQTMESMLPNIPNFPDAPGGGFLARMIALFKNFTFGGLWELLKDILFAIGQGILIFLLVVASIFVIISLIKYILGLLCSGLYSLLFKREESKTESTKIQEIVVQDDEKEKLNTSTKKTSKQK